jgi:CRISPR system Cascade subunit CasA
MNLSTDRWIPVVWNNGTAGLVSLDEVFQRGRDIRDLAVRPHERVALMRLLLCVAHAALDGPADHDDWQASLERVPGEAEKYLAKWRAAFELLGEGPRFLQVSNLVSTKSDDDEGNSVSKLDVALATGNNSTLFDNSGGSERTFTPAQLALMLLTFQCFSPCGTIGVAMWNGKPTIGWTKYPKPAPGQSAHAPCLPSNMLHAFPRAESLLASLHLNLVSRDEALLVPGIKGWGKPIWEHMPTSPEDKAAMADATETYVGRLVPLSRAIRLNENRRELVLANGLDYPSWPELREPSATVVIREVKGKPDRFLVGASLQKAPWRELNALTVKMVAAKTNGGPLALANLDGEKPFDLWVGGMVAAGNNKILDTIEAVYHVPAAMLQSTGQRCYEQGIKFVEDAAWRLGQAVSTYHREIGDSLDRPEVRDRRDKLRAKAAFQFWTQAERNVPLLLGAVANGERPSDLKAWRQSEWGKAVHRAAREAYELACPRQTARQMQAFVKGLSTLFSSRENNATH